MRATLEGASDRLEVDRLIQELGESVTLEGGGDVELALELALFTVANGMPFPYASPNQWSPRWWPSDVLTS